MLRRVDIVRTDVSEELSASSMKVTKIGELGTTLIASTRRHNITEDNIPFKNGVFWVVTPWLL
jgi:hypothetical protein